MEKDVVIKTTLFKILLKKEAKFWKRLREMFMKFNGWGMRLTFGIIASLISIIAHYAMAFMSTLWESALYVFARNMFKSNLQKLAITT